MNRFLGIAVICFLVYFGFALGQEETNQSMPSELARELQSLLDEAVEETETVGAVLLIQTPTVKWLGASGFASLSSERSMLPEDSLRLASMTKTFVAAMILKLSEEGKFSLDDNIDEYLPDDIMREIPNGSDITIRQLVNMTSGIYSYTESEAFNDAIEDNLNSKRWTIEEILSYIYEEAAVFQPGAAWDYSNSNYLLLDLLIQAISGDTFANEFDRLIAKPLGLEHTFMESPDNIAKLEVRGYEENWEDVTDVPDAFGLADGGLVSDAKGVANFLNALLVDKSLLQEASLKSMLEFHPKEDYGLGIQRSFTDYGEALGHSGASFGFQGDMLVIPEKQVIFVILTNTMETDITDWLLDESLSILFD